MHPGSLATDQVMHPPKVSDVGPWPLMWVRTHPGFQLWAPRLLVRVRTHPGFQVWAPRPLIGVCTHPEALGLCTRAAWLLIRMCTNRASGVCWGCLSGIHKPGSGGARGHGC